MSCAKNAANDGRMGREEAHGREQIFGADNRDCGFIHVADVGDIHGEAAAAKWENCL